MTMHFYRLKKSSIAGNVLVVIFGTASQFNDVFSWSSICSLSQIFLEFLFVLCDFLDQNLELFLGLTEYNKTTIMSKFAKMSKIDPPYYTL